MTEGNCNVCGDVCTIRCGSCKAIFYCGTAHQKKDWKIHKQSCRSSSPSPPHPPDLAARARNFEFDDEFVGSRDNADAEHDMVQTLCYQIEKNAYWCLRNHENLTVLLDATRALRALHEKAPSPQGGDDSIPNWIWHQFNGSDDAWGCDAWRAVSGAWLHLIEVHKGKLAIKSGIARELFEFYQKFHQVGWDQLEEVVQTQEWAGMIEVRDEKKGSLPKVHSGDEPKVQMEVKAMLTKVIEARLEEELEEEGSGFFYGNYQDECIPMMRTFIQSDRLDEYLHMAVKWFCNLWNECMDRINPEESWGITLWPDWNDGEVARQCKVGEIIGLECYKDREAVKNHGSLRFMFLDVEKIFRWCLEDVLDPDGKLDVHRDRYG